MSVIHLIFREGDIKICAKYAFNIHVSFSCHMH